MARWFNLLWPYVAPVILMVVLYACYAEWRNLYSTSRRILWKHHGRT